MGDTQVGIVLFVYEVVHAFCHYRVSRHNVVLPDILLFSHLFATLTLMQILRLILA